MINDYINFFKKKVIFLTLLIKTSYHYIMINGCCKNNNKIPWDIYSIHKHMHIRYTYTYYKQTHSNIYLRQWNPYFLGKICVAYYWPRAYANQRRGRKYGNGINKGFQKSNTHHMTRIFLFSIRNVWFQKSPHVL